MLAAKTDWAAYSTNGTIGSDLSKNNSSGFSALPGGGRSYNGTFYGQSFGGGWWSATEGGASRAYGSGFNYGIGNLNRSDGIKSCGFSVRLVRDN